MNVNDPEAVLEKRLTIRKKLNWRWILEVGICIKTISFDNRFAFLWTLGGPTVVCGQRSAGGHLDLQVICIHIPFLFLQVWVWTSPLGFWMELFVFPDTELKLVITFLESYCAD